MMSECGSASARGVLHQDAREHDSGYDRDRLWNPLPGTRPWLEPIGYRMAPYRIDAEGRRVIEREAKTIIPATTEVQTTRVLHHHPRGEVCHDPDHHH